MADDKESVKDEQIEFKKPVLFGRIGKLPKKVKTDAEKPSDEKQTEKPVKNTSESSSKSSLPPAVLIKESSPIPYKEPKWSGLCPEGSDYALEVLKSGMIVDKVELMNKPYYVFGRLTNCDVVMAHPTVSRYHAVLQYKAFAAEGEPSSGWYLYDLESTHGTFLNRERLKPTHYTRVRVGHQIKFGNSSRTHIVAGPDFDCEGESELSVTEIKQRAEHMKQERDRMIQEAVEQRERDRLAEEKKREDQGIDWGMSEDAEEEPDLAENPYAVAANEELYLTDPKKTLRGYCEREGHELNYDCEERGVGQFMCRVELPLDDARGRPVVAEVMHRGKKKEAVVACALEACRLLDRAGLLRRATHEPRGRRRKEYDPDNYSDSDDDTFLDRTGAVERKRARMRGQKETNNDKALTYDDLLEQISSIESRITSEEKALDRLRATPAEAEGDEDALDEYMRQLGRQTMAQKADISKTKMSIQKLKASLSKTQRLADLARPAHLPPLVKTDSKMAVKQNNSVIYGKRIKLKEDLDRKSKKKIEVKKPESEFIEEMDSDEEENMKTDNKSEDRDSKHKAESANETTIQAGSKEMSAKEIETPVTVRERDIDTQITEGVKETAIEVEKRVSETDAKIYGPMRPPENYVIPENYFDQETERDCPEILEKDDLSY